MIPFHLFLFLIFENKKEVTFEQYQHQLLVNQLREKSKDVRYVNYHQHNI